MTKVLPATCTAGVVMAGDPPLPLPTAEVFSEGVAASEGLAILEGEDAYYFPNVAPDLKTTLQQVVAALAQTKTALDQIGSAFTTVDAKPTGGTGSAVVATVAANVSAIAAAATAIDAAKTALNTLSGALR